MTTPPSTAAQIGGRNGLTIEKQVLRNLSRFAAPRPEPQETLQAAYCAPEIKSLDLRQAGISTIIWAMGYHFDFCLVKFPVFDTFGLPLTRGGVTQVPGLYFVGLPWMDTIKAGLLVGVGEASARLAEHMGAS